MEVEVEVEDEEEKDEEEKRYLRIANKDNRGATFGVLFGTFDNVARGLNRNGWELFIGYVIRLTLCFLPFGNHRELPAVHVVRPLLTRNLSNAFACQGLKVRQASRAGDGRDE
ncbi:hypothetical protein HZH68_008771 [Vespula germanica]|uniref:Uncharacterized protein n=1 Tax=Vespula germanica TaxID=30212 RepID=A0A834N7C0_VESGE|nr:hypothetical protein HZH68_008771 [Vespula germanica]